LPKVTIAKESKLESWSAGDLDEKARLSVERVIPAIFGMLAIFGNREEF